MNAFVPNPTRWIKRRHLFFCMSLVMTLFCASLVMMTGCPPGDSGVSPAGTSNNPPTVNAGSNQIVSAGASVTLDGSASSDPDSDVISFAWEQRLGPPVTLSGADSPIATFTAPEKNVILAFKLTVGDGQSDAAGTTSVSVQLIDPSVPVEERLQRSVTEDPAAMGNFPKDWLIPDAGAGLTPPPSDDLELPEFVEMFEKTQVPPIVQEDLSPGATRTVSLDIAGPSGLAGLVQWIGTTSALDVTIALDGNNLAANATTYQMGTDRGGTYLQTQATAAGLASISVTNTTDATVTVRIIFMATAQ